MAKLKEIYKCDSCGNVSEILHSGIGTLVCCDESMKLLEEQTEDSTEEHHVPIIEKIEGGYKVKVGKNANHPMKEDHYIEWIELIANDVIYRKHLYPGDSPEATFMIEADDVTARELSNKHGLWINKH